ncbi:Ig-like domain-containing protein [Sunxiuqinia elliptica]|uniref:Gliding motility-associated-like protein n=1 Tax=Sunxiuqinia elliptica TaxID=655355 RepID=A0A4R6H7U0_9BACT|nr:Ig-like domain-containing protein [Sunxiuqinia elliptica]TDO04094.1 gliding motility-associated-like protein [Sunxiuqinia elliptica]TDO62376.1 gliding motility-associated-like protein [Sunxiuqinia elliptica]
MKRLMYILTLLLFAATVAAQEPYVIDRVCQGIERTYRIDGEAGSSWQWMLADADGNAIALSDPAGTDFSDTNKDGNPIQGSEITIDWEVVPGTYDLSVEQTSIHGCIVHELGQVEVYPNAEADAGNPLTVCVDDPIVLTEASATEYSSLEWTSSGDGTFDDATLLNPSYTAGENDKQNGSVILTLTTQGLLNNGTCEPAVSTIEVTITDIQLTSNQTNVSCYGDSDGTATVIPSQGTEPYTYSWDDPAGQTTQTATGLAAGTYHVTVTDDNNCQQTTEVIITQPLEILLAIDQLDVTCHGGSDGSATVNITNGVAPFTYLWNDPSAQTTQTAMNLAAGDYEVTVTDANGCEEKSQVTITEPPADILATISSTNISCFGANDGTATVSASDGVEPYTYLWDDPAAQTAKTATNLAAGTYTVVVTDAKGCTTEATVTITEPAELTATITGIDVLCFGENSGSATATPAGGTAPYTYQWDDPAAQTTQTATNLVAGTYSVIVTDNNGCTVLQTIIITEPVELTATVTGVDVLCYGESTGSATITPTGGTAPYTYLWDDSAVQTTQTATNLAAGTYNVTITDDNNCTVSASVTINQPDEPIALTPSSSDVDCYGGDNGYASIVATGGTPPYAYLWDDLAAQTTSAINNLVAGDYTVTVTDANNCTETATITISQPPVSVVASITTTPISCFGANDGTATVTASDGIEPYTYLWDDPSAQTTQTATNLAAGTYTVVVTDDKGCPAEATVTITEPAELTATITGIDVLCFGENSGSATVTPTGGTAPYTYQWDDPAAQTTQTATNLAAGTYSVIVTDNNGCTVPQTITITEPVELTATATGADVLCYGESTGSATVTPTGGTAPYTYLWDDPAAQTTQTATNLVAGTYNVTVTDDNNCTISASVTISQPDEPIALTPSSSDVDCYGGNNGSASIVATGGTPPYAYLWDDPAAQTNSTINNLVAGDYTVTVTDANNCQETATITISQPPVSVIASATATPVTCFGDNNGTATVTASDGIEPYTYLWDDPSAQTTQTATNLAAGTYTVVVTDDKGCPAEATVTITEPAELTATITKFEVLCFGENSGSATVTPTGGTAPYTYQWDDPAAQTTQTATNLAAGTYSVIVTDNNGCTVLQTITITEPVELTATAAGVDVLCYGESTGSATATPTGGTAPYTYLWDDPAAQTTQTATNLVAGIYNVTVTDDNNCTISASVTISQPDEPIALTPSSSDVDCYGGDNGSASIVATGGTPPYGYLWDDPAAQTTSAINNLVAGDYTVTVTDANNCKETATITISQPPVSVIASATATPVTCFGDNNGTATVTASNGVEPYTYQWDDPLAQTTQTATNLTAGTYTVIVTDVKGCQTTATTTVDSPDEITVTISVTDAICFGETTGSATVYASGGTAPYSYLWNDPAAQTTQTASGLTAGDYQVTVIDANDCRTQTSIRLYPPPNLVITNPLAICEPDLVDITAPSVTAGSTIPATAVISYWLDSGTSQPLSQSDAEQISVGATYYIRVDVGNDCYDVKPVEVTIYPEPDLIIQDPTAVCEPDVIDLTASEITPGLDPALVKTYWHDQAVTNEISEPTTISVEGTYYIQVESADGCKNIEPVQVIINKPDALSFNLQTQLCVNSTPPALPTTSVGGITGSWNKATISTDQTGFFTYVFTPDPGQCAVENTVTVEITDEIVPIFDPMGPYCLGTTPPALPTVSNNNITGSWSPAVISTDQLGTDTYIFTPDPGQCATSTTIDITIEQSLSLDATPMNIDCKGDNSGSIQLTVTGGSGSYSYAWSNGATTRNIANLYAGTYQVTVVDQISGCENDISVTVSEPNLNDNEDPTLTAPPAVHTQCSTNWPAPYTTYSEFEAAGGYATDNLGYDVSTFEYVSEQRTQSGQSITLERIYRIRDYCGNPATAVQVFQSKDDIPPEAICNSIEISVDENGQYQLTNVDIREIAQGSYDNCTSFDDLVLDFSPMIFDCEMVGKTATGTLTVSDLSGNVSTCEATIIILDTFAPEITCQSVTLYLDENGQANLGVDDVLIGVDDNCGIDNITLSQTEFFCEDVGTQTEVITVTDIHDLSASCEFTVTVVDTIKPRVTCHDLEVLLDRSEQFTLTYDLISSDIWDECGVERIEISKDLLTCADIGLNPITITVYDVNGNANECTSNVTVIADNQQPVATNDVDTTIMNISTTIAVLDNDYDPDGSIIPSSITITKNPAHGSLQINSDNTITYTPNNQYTGPDEFTYQICDDGVPCETKCDEATVSLTILVPNVAPVATVDQFAGGCYTIFGSLLYNDYDPNGDQIIINTTPTLEPSQGVVTIFADGTFRYEFERGDAFIDSFRYQICDDNPYPLCSETTVYITIFADADCDGIADHIDIDDDNDGIIDVVEGDRTVDTDGDGIPDSLDIDADNDGIIDIIEAQEENKYIPPSGIDNNENGLDDIYEQGSQVGLDPTDTDGDGDPDYVDTDSDNDNVPDYIEGYDIGAKGIAELVPEISDIDGDGLDDAYDNFLGGFNENDLDDPFGTNPHLQDFDNDGTRDWRDTDDDNDMIPTAHEDLNNNNIYFDDDLDFDGHPEYLDYQGECTMFIPEGFSPNGDGIHDFFQIYCIDKYPNAKLLIFDRWGNKMYEHDKYGNLSYWGSFEKAWWDGSRTNEGAFSGEKLKPGNYLYVLVKGDGNTEKGFVMVSY